MERLINKVAVVTGASKGMKVTLGQQDSKAYQDILKM